MTSGDQPLTRARQLRSPRAPAYSIKGSTGHLVTNDAAGSERESPLEAVDRSNDLEWVEIVARRTADLVLEGLDQRAGAPIEAVVLVDAKTMAEMLGVSRDHVYRHADELGAIRTGGTLRFDPDRVTRRSLSKRSQGIEVNAGKAMTRPRAPRSGAGARRVPQVRLLPIGSLADRRRRKDG